MAAPKKLYFVLLLTKRGKWKKTKWTCAPYVSPIRPAIGKVAASICLKEARRQYPDETYKLSHGHCNRERGSQRTVLSREVKEVA